MIYRFDNFQLDTDRFELRHDGVPVALEPKVLALIVLLIERRNRLVTKEELIETIWDGRVVSDSAISTRIKKARDALQDSGETPRLIRTVHRKGYRFVGRLLGEGGADAATSMAAVAARATARPRVIILPFVNLSGDMQQEYFSDAITQDLITNLSKHRWLEVVARNTAFAYKNKDVDWQQLVETLGVSYVVEGSVLRAGDRIRATTQLVEVLSQRPIWSDRYDRHLQDVFEVQDEITAKIAARIEPAIGAFERRKVPRSGERDLQAWECYHLGIWHFFKFTAADNVEAQRLLQACRELDPDFGEAHAWWAYAVVLGMVYWDTEPATALLDAALEATQQALDIDDQNAVFYALKARVQLARCDYQSALIGNSIAIELNPTLAAAHCGLADSLAYEGRYEESIEAFEHAIELSPNDPQRWAFLTYGAMAHIFKGDFETAIDWTDKACEIPNCQFWTHAHRAVAFAYLGDVPRAKHEVEHVLRERPNFSRSFARNKLFFIKDPEQLEVYLEGLRRAGVEDAM